jgi:hypothetical protein
MAAGWGRGRDVEGQYPIGCGGAVAKRSNNAKRPADEERDFSLGRVATLQAAEDTRGGVPGGVSACA